MRHQEWNTGPHVLDLVTVYGNSILIAIVYGIRDPTSWIKRQLKDLGTRLLPLEHPSHAHLSGGTIAYLHSAVAPGSHLHSDVLLETSRPSAVAPGAPGPRLLPQAAPGPRLLPLVLHTCVVAQLPAWTCRWQALHVLYTDSIVLYVSLNCLTWLAQLFHHRWQALHVRRLLHLR